MFCRLVRGSMSSTYGDFLESRKRRRRKNEKMFDLAAWVVCLGTIHTVNIIEDDDNCCIIAARYRPFE